MSATDLQSIIVKGDAKVTVEQARKLGENLAQQKLTTNQIRNIFGTVRRIEMNWPENASEEQARKAHRDLLLLKPKLAYQAKREGGRRGRGVETLRQVLDQAIDLVEGEHDRFQNFVDFFEATLAYHKAYGGN